MPKFNRKLVQTEPFQVIRDSAGRVIKVIFPHQVEFGFENDSNFQGQVSFKNSDPVDAKGGKINSEATSGNFNLTSDGIGTALGFTPANIANTARSDLSNVSASSGRSALGVSDHVTGSLSDIFDNLTPTKVTTGLGFTPINVTLSNAPSTILNSSISKSSLGLGNVENKTSSEIRGEIDSSNISTSLGFTPANVTGDNFDSAALSNIISSGKGANGYSIEYDEVGGFESEDNQYVLKAGASGVVGQRNINVSTIYNSTATTVITSDTTGYALTVENDSNSSVTSPNGVKITMDNAVATDDSGYFVYATIRGSRHYYVKSDGDGTSSVSLTFTGQHNVACLKDPEMIPGMIVECTGESWVKNTDLSGEVVTYSTCLPRVKLSNTLGSKKVFGVLSLDSNKKNDDGENNLNYLGVASGSFPGLVEKNGINILDRHVEVMSLGEGCIWVTDYNGDIQCGDLVMSSPVKGYGCLQEDDIMRSKTVAKITEDIDWANVLDTLTYEGISYKHFLATCTFHCG